MAKHDVLMSQDNPAGWKLEELVDKLRHELALKQARLAHAIIDMDRGKDPTGRRAFALKVMQNNRDIDGYLEQIGVLQLDTQAALDCIGPDQGPTGPSRLG